MLNVVCCVGSVEIQIEILRGWDTADIRIVTSNISSVDNMFLSDEGLTLETLDFTIHIGSIYTSLFI